ncbi:uncharacterized protein LOC144562417 [Carex rostrata]
MGACASKPKEEHGPSPSPSPSPMAPPAEDTSTHYVAPNTVQEKTDAVEAPLVDLSETKPEETPAEVSTPTSVKELAPVLSEAPAEAAAQPNKEQEEKAQDTDKPKTTETKEEESKATN